MRVYLCSYHDSRRDKSKEVPDTIERREKLKDRTDLTEYPQYDFDNTLNNTKDFEPYCFIEAEP